MDRGRRFNACGLYRRGGCSSSVSGGGGGGVAPTITVAPVLAWTGGIGSSPVLTDPTYTGDPGTITWTYYRDGVADGTILNVNKATAEAYVAAWSGTETGVNDMVERVFRATVTNGAGSDFDDSNAQFYDDATDLPLLTGGTTLDDLVLADSDTTVDQWGSSIGGTATTMLATDAARRPAYSATGGVGSRPAMTFDGSNDTLGFPVSSTAFGTMSTIEGGVVARSLGGTTAGRYMSYVSGGAFMVREANPTYLAQWDVAATGTTDSRAATVHMSGDGTSAGDMNARAAGVIEATASPVGATELGDRVLDIGARTSGGGNPSNCRMQAWYFGVGLTADQRLNLRALLTARTGVAC